MSEAIIDGFPWVFCPSWSQSSQNGVPIVQLMLRASYRSIISTTGNSFSPNWDQNGQKPKKSYQSTKAAGPASAAMPTIGPCRRGPGQSPCLELSWRRCRRPPLPVHHRTSVSPGAPPGPHSTTAPKFTCVPTANPHRTDGFLKDFGVPRTPKICIMSTGRFEN